MQVIINAAGMGTRLGQGCKSLISIAGKPLIRHQICAIRSFLPDAKILIVVGHQAREVGQAAGDCANTHLVFNPHYEDRGVVESVLRATKSGHFNAMLPTLRIDGDLLLTDTAPLAAMCASGVNRIAVQVREQPAHTPVIQMVNGIFHSVRLEQDYVGESEWPCVEFYVPPTLTHMMSYASSFLRRHYYELVNHYNAIAIRRDRFPAFSPCHVYGIKEIDNATDLRRVQDFVRGREHLLDFKGRVPAVQGDADEAVLRPDVARAQDPK